jgi:site-specific DNA-methyltransferase (adenine-specific)
MTGLNSGGYSRFLNFHGRNPDVLNSIANLSNDEVFTPPEFANRMLDTLEKAWAESNSGENIWSNPNLKFLDPFTKSGVFLREIATRLISGLDLEIPDLQDRVDHILTKQVYGIATTRLTSLMARRSLYCSKNANGKHSVTKKFNNENGNIWFEPIAHTWNKGTVVELTMDELGKEVERYVDGKCKYCGASKRDFERQEGLELHAYGLIHTDDPDQWVREKFGDHMRFDVVIGNPPYQLSDGGGEGASAVPIYQHFIEAAKKLDPAFLAMVVPARWYTGGRGLDSFRMSMIQDKTLSELHDFPETSLVFPGVNIRGGVCYFLLSKANTALPRITNYSSNSEPVSESRNLAIAGTDVVARYNTAIPILEKVIAKSKENYSSRVFSRNPFGLGSNFSRYSLIKNLDSDLVLYRSRRSASEDKVVYVADSEIEQNRDLVSKVRVVVSKASPGGDEFPHAVLSEPIVCLPGSASTETYLIVDVLENTQQAEFLKAYMRTRFFRFMLSMVRSTQNISKGSFRFVPTMPLTREWDDASLYSHFGIDEKDQKFIEEIVRESSW